MEKGVLRFEANISLRPEGSNELGTRVEIKNLNSFRAMEKGVAFEIERQTAILESGGRVDQETRGWNEETQSTYVQRSKEEAHDYRYFTEPDLPPLVVENEWIEKIRAALPELPRVKALRFQKQFGLTPREAGLLAAEGETADYFEACAAALNNAPARSAASWILGELFAWVNVSGSSVSALKVTPSMLAELIDAVQVGTINLNTGKSVLTEMLTSGRQAGEIIRSDNLAQVSDTSFIADLVSQVLQQFPAELASYRSGKESLANWFFGQVMRAAGGKANPAVIRAELDKQLQYKE
jgi:aspartyl-tRNA(Asn)/glutamyl-tRNA(Gln) amidotransferase subunit B